MTIVYYPDKEEINKTFDDIKAIAFDENVKVGTRLDALKFVFEHFSIRSDDSITKEYFNRQLEEFENKKDALVKEIEELENAKKALDDEGDGEGGDTFWSGFFGWLNRSDRGKS